MDTSLPTSRSIPLPTAFVRLSWSNLAAQMAEQISLAAAPLIAVIALGSGAGGSGLLQAMQTLPFLLLSIPAGILADRASRHRMMLLAEGIRLGSLLAILALVLTDQLTMTRLVALGFIGATGTVIYSVCTPALVPTLVPRDRLIAANGRLELVRSTSFIAGPALGGLLVGWLGGSTTYALATACSLLALLLLTGIREPARVPTPRHTPIADLREGATFLFGSVLLRPLFFTAVFFNLGFYVLMGIYAPYAHDHLGLSAGEIGVTLAIDGVGMLIGATVAGWLMQRLPFGRVLCIGPLFGLAAILVMTATIWWQSVWIASLAFFLIGVGPMVWTVSSTTLRQTVTPDALLGRVSAVILTATFGARPLGAGIAALVGSTISLRACLLVAVVGFAIQATIILRSIPARMTTLPAHA